MLGVLKLLPFPVKIGLVVVALFFVWTLAHSLAGILTVLAILAWAAVVGTVLYAAGVVPRLGTLPLLGPMFASLAGVATSGSAGAPARGSVAAAGVPPTPRVDRAKLAARGERQLRELLGSHPAVTTIFDDIVPHARVSASEKKRLFGLSRPWVVVVHGPRGVGTSTVARALADLLIGLDVVARPVALAIEPPPPGRADTEWSQVLERGLDAVLLLDDADWLAETTLRGAGTVSQTVLATLLNLANRGAGKVAVIASMTSEAFDSAFTSGAAAYLKRMTFKELECVPLDDAALAQIFSHRLAEHGIHCSDAARDEVVRFARGARGYLGKQFDYADAMRRAAEHVVARLKIAGRSVAEPDDVRTLSSDRS